MKTRIGFVSNSSSSSYICGVCGNKESGWDLCLDDAGMVECVNGHTFCTDHRICAKNDESKCDDCDHDKECDACEEEFDNDDGESFYDLPESQCPLCQFHAITDDDLAKWLLKQAGKSRKDVLKELKAQFPDYNTFAAQIKKVVL